MAPEANRITNRTVRNQIQAEIDGTLDEHRSLAETKLDATVIQPLIDLQLALLSLKCKRLKNCCSAASG